jgi:hypothetical protein
LCCLSVLLSIFTVVLSVPPFVYFYYCAVCPSFCLFLLLCCLSLLLSIFIIVLSVRHFVYFYYCVVCPSFFLFLLLFCLFFLFFFFIKGTDSTIVKIDKRTDRQHNRKNRQKYGQITQ